MFTRKQLIVSCVASFLVGAATLGGFGYYRLTSAMQVFSHFEMIEDFSQGTAMVSHLQNGNYDYAYDFFSQALEDSCTYYLSEEFKDSVDQEHARALVKEAQEVTGLCK